MSESRETFEGGFLKKCPICGEDIGPESAKIAELKNNPSVFFVSCFKCGGSMFASIGADLFGIGALSVITDLAESELDKFENSNPISSDEMLDMHLISKKRGNVYEPERKK